MGSEVSLVRRSATTLPMIGPNLNPCPEHGETINMFSCSSLQSIKKSSVLVTV